jgi:truncated hemoglobin YjbI
MRPETTAHTVTERVDALADALRAAGVPPEASAQLLASAATAAVHAVMLDALLEETAPPVPRGRSLLVAVEPAAALAA